jgi:hypothetical protein
VTAEDSLNHRLPYHHHEIGERRIIGPNEEF